MTTRNDAKKRLLEAAGQVFGAKGFDAATVREICRLAKVGNVAAINYYFRDKETLYREAVQHAYAARLSFLPRPDWPSDVAPADKLRGFLHGMLGALLEGSDENWESALLMREMANPSPGCVDFVRHLGQPAFELLLSILNEIMPKETPAVKRHLLALSIMGQCIYHRVARPLVSMLVGEGEFRTYDAARLADHIAAFSLAALGLDRGVPLATVPAAGQEAP